MKHTRTPAKTHGANTWHEKALKTHVENLLANDPNYVEVLTHIYQQMCAGWFDYVADVVQRDASGHRTYTFVDAYVVAQIHRAMFDHKIAMLTIGMPITAQPDRRLPEISEALQDRTTPFTIDLWGGVGDDDGTLSWSRPVRAYLPAYEPTESSEGYREFRQHMDVLLLPSRLPIEVGSTKSSRTWTHLLQDGGVARWAYGSNRINSYVVLKDLHDGEVYGTQRCTVLHPFLPSMVTMSHHSGDHLQWVP